MTPEQSLVQGFARGSSALESLRGLTGGVTSTHLRSVILSGAAFDALVEGLADPHPRIRWWCIQVLDHVPDPRALAAIAPLLDDPVPRVRRNAAHALGCVICKPAWEGALPDGIADKLARLASDDPSPKVRAEAAHAISCRT